MERLMLWVSSANKSTAKMAVDDDDVSSWEIINPSDDETLSFSGSLSGKGSSSDDGQPGFEENDQKVDERSGFDDGDVDQKDDERPGFVEPEYMVPGLVLSQADDHESSFSHRRWGLDDEYKDCDERLRSSDYDDGEHDLDDNLVPFSVSNRFGKQRMGKVGKKGNNGMIKKSKRMPSYYYNKVV